MLKQSDWQPHGPGGARAPSLPVADLMISHLGESTFLDLIRKSPDFIRAYKGKQVWWASKGISGGIESPDTAGRPGPSLAQSTPSSMGLPEERGESAARKRLERADSGQRTSKGQS